MIPMKATTRTAVHQLCQQHGLTDEQYRDFCNLFETEYTEMAIDLDKARREKIEVDRKNERAHEVLKQTGERYNSQLMSVYYLLGSLQTVGTHHEKEVVIRFIRQTLNDLLDKGGDKLSWNQDLFPF
jgi:hypothetical protein